MYWKCATPYIFLSISQILSPSTTFSSSPHVKSNPANGITATQYPSSLVRVNVPSGHTPESAIKDVVPIEGQVDGVEEEDGRGARDNDTSVASGGEDMVSMGPRLIRIEATNHPSVLFGDCRLRDVGRVRDTQIGKSAR
ncbi:hypothetical protein BDR22DRAFT_821680 [Usnea florida]